MEFKNFIDKLSQNNANYNNPEQAITTANLCDTISRDINTDSQRFIYELLQNADDSSNQSGLINKPNRSSTFTMENPGYLSSELMRKQGVTFNQNSFAQQR